LAENFCNGIYLNDASSGLILNGPSKTNAAVYNLAIAHFDSALVLVSGNSALTNTATLAKARAFIELGQSATAAALVSSIATSFTDASTLSGTESNKLFLFNSSQKRYSLDDSINSAGVVANAYAIYTQTDPRLSVTIGG